MNRWYFGTSGLVLQVPNKTHYPEEYQSGSRLHYYGSVYNSIEINSTFYRLPRADTVKKWAAEVSGDFTFTFKIPSEVSHEPELNFKRDVLLRFLETVEGVERKKGFLLLQVPAKMQANTAKLKQILNILKKSDWRIAFESRNTSWYQPPVEKLLQKFDVTRVIHDWWNFKIPMETSARNVYLRFHGPERNYRGSYDDIFLKDCAMRIKKWIKEGKLIYVYFNNTLGNVSGNLTALIKNVNQRKKGHI